MEDKINKAQADLELLRSAYMNDSNNGTDDTSPTFKAFEEGIGSTRTEFGLAIGIQMLFWGMFAPIFGLIADKLGGNKAVFIGFIIHYLSPCTP